jgi:hypothetical protein
MVTIELDSDAVNTIEIVNAEGTTAKTISFDGSVTKVNTSDLAPGVYFVRIYTNTGTVIQKLVIQ